MYISNFHAKITIFVEKYDCSPKKVTLQLLFNHKTTKVIHKEKCIKQKFLRN